MTVPIAENHLSLLWQKKGDYSAEGISSTEKYRTQRATPPLPKHQSDRTTSCVAAVRCLTHTYIYGTETTAVSTAVYSFT